MLGSGLGEREAMAEEMMKRKKRKKRKRETETEEEGKEGEKLLQANEKEREEMVMKETKEEKKKKKKKKMSKNERDQKLFAAQNIRVAAHDPQPSLRRERPFSANPDDHCETPFSAYRDIEPFLFFLSRHLKKKSKADLRIYDPYYCEGSVVKHLAALGFTNVYNKKEDFYAVAAQGRVPPHDVLVSNPPFSGDHMERIVRFAQHNNAGRPWLLLMPNFMCRKPTYAAAMRNEVYVPASSSLSSSSSAASISRKRGGSTASRSGNATPIDTAAAVMARTSTAQPSSASTTANGMNNNDDSDNDNETSAFYVVPARKYSFWSPGREFKAEPERIADRIAAGVHKTHGKFTAPFNCMWFCQLGKLAPFAYDYWNKKYSKLGQCSLARTPDELPEHATVPKHEKRKGPKARKREAERRRIEARNAMR